MPTSSTRFTRAPSNANFNHIVSPPHHANPTAPGNSQLSGYKPRSYPLETLESNVTTFFVAYRVSFIARILPAGLLEQQIRQKNYR